MTSATAPQITHESEAQRQHVRVQIPAKAVIDGVPYALKDLSVSGLSVEGVKDAAFKTGDSFRMTLAVAFDSFSFNVELDVMVEYYDQKKDLLGCQFKNLTPQQVSTLNVIIKSYLSGVIVAEGDILNVVARDNFVRIRKDLQVEAAKDLPHLIKRALPTLSLILVGLLGLIFFSGNLYEKMSILKSYQASVQTDPILVRSLTDGLFTSTLPEGIEKVAQGQELGYTESLPLQAPGSYNSGPQSMVKNMVYSPCECYLVYKFARNGVFRGIGEPLFKLIPIDTAPVIRVMVQARDVQRLNLQDKAEFQIAGEEGKSEGRIIDIEAGDTSVSSGLITVRPERDISYELSDRPAYVEFQVR